MELKYIKSLSNTFKQNYFSTVTNNLKRYFSSFDASQRDILQY